MTFATAFVFGSTTQVRSTFSLALASLARQHSLSACFIKFAVRSTTGGTSRPSVTLPEMLPKPSPCSAFAATGSTTTTGLGGASPLALLQPEWTTTKPQRISKFKANMTRRIGSISKETRAWQDFLSIHRRHLAARFFLRALVHTILHGTGFRSRHFQPRIKDSRMKQRLLTPGPTPVPEET